MTHALALELDLDGDLVESGERACADVFVRARRCESSFPAAWLDTADLTVLHDAANPLCECVCCGDKRRAKLRTYAADLLETVSERLLAEMYALPSDNDNCNDAQSVIPTSRPPSMPAVGSQSDSGELQWRAL